MTFHRSKPLLVAVLSAATLPVSALAWAGQTISVKPGDDIQSMVNNSPAGTTFTFTAGVYRLLQIKPKTGDTFVGSGNSAILTGAAQLSNFMSTGGDFASPYSQSQGQLNGSCLAQSPMCQYPEDLFFDEKPLARVSSVNQVAPGKWFLDYGRQLVIFADNPSGHIVEISSARSAFSGSAANVTIEGLTVEKYAIPAQMGAIGDQYPGQNWKVKHCLVRLNHGAGIHVLSGGVVQNNVVTQNGQLGIGASGAKVVIQSNEISFNNTGGFDPGWEAGGTKFSLTTNLTVRSNYVHDNAGAGLWTDTENDNALYDQNVVTNNTGIGIEHEISYAATIQNNVVSGNGVTSGFLWGTQILVQNSRNVEVKNNVVKVNATTGNGIGIINQNRGLDSKGVSYDALNNYIHDNDITYEGAQGSSGVTADYNLDQTYAGSNHFDYNHYHASQITIGHWQWLGMQTFASFQTLGQEQHGTADTQVK